jgi:hypothetical protein
MAAPALPLEGDRRSIKWRIETCVAHAIVFFYLIADSWDALAVPLLAETVVIVSVVVFWGCVAYVCWHYPLLFRILELLGLAFVLGWALWVASGVAELRRKPRTSIHDEPMG